MERVIRFTVPGQPCPYLRQTQGQVKLVKIPLASVKSRDALRVRERIQRYLGYKDLVRLCSNRFDIDRNPKRKVFLNVMIYFADEWWPCDPDNCRKGIQDAIYINDRMVAGSVDFAVDEANPRVEVEIREAE